MIISSKHDNNMNKFLYFIITSNLLIFTKNNSKKNCGVINEFKGVAISSNAAECIPVKQGLRLLCRLPGLFYPSAPM